MIKPSSISGVVKPAFNSIPLVPIKDFVKLKVFSDLKPSAPIIASVAGLILPPIVYVVSPFLIRFFAWVIPFVT